MRAHEHKVAQLLVDRGTFNSLSVVAAPTECVELVCECSPHDPTAEVGSKNLTDLIRDALAHTCPET